MISIQALFSDRELEERIQADADEWLNGLGEEMMQTGMSMVDKAISKAKTGKFTGGGFGNISYDLRSSMGCGLVVNKEVKQTYFPFKATNKGKSDGIALINQVATEIDSIGVIMVAGENYAVFVETKGYDVISMSWTQLELILFKN